VHGGDWLAIIVVVSVCEIKIRLWERRGNGTHQNRTSFVIRRADSRGIGDRRTWDASLCVGNPWLNQDHDERDHDERKHGEGILKKNQTGGVQKECCLDPEVKTQGSGSNSEVKPMKDVARNSTHAFG
jgi:hypothetical protein